MEAKNARLRRRILNIVLIVIGLALILYPLVSSWYNRRILVEQISGYEHRVEAEQDASLAEQLALAKAYNEALFMARPEPLWFDAATGTYRYDYDSFPRYFDTDQVVASLEIPKIGVKLPVFMGADDAVLAKGVGAIRGASLPVGGENSHAALTGHRGLPQSELFRYLDKIEAGDLFFVSVLGETLAYRAESVTVVAPSETEHLAIEPGRDLCTLVTCTPYAINSDRMLVKGVRVPYVAEEAIVEAAKIDTADLFWVRYREYVIGGAVLAVALLAVLLGRRRRAEEEIKKAP